MTVKNRRVFELRLGKVGLIAFIGGMSLLLFTMFLLGIIVGKHMEAYPERYAFGIAELIRDRFFAAVSKGEKGAASGLDEEKEQEPAAGKAEFGLTFYDTLGGKKGRTVVEEPIGTGKANPSGSSAAQALPAGRIADTGLPISIPGGLLVGETASVPSGDTERTKSNPSAGKTAGERETVKPATGEAERQGKGRFEIQVAAYREISQAQRLAKKIAAMGYLSRVVAKELPGKGRWFRVIVGSFESRPAAQEAAGRLTGKIRGLKFVIRSSETDGNGG